jgi:hypothetical protein
MANSKMKCNTWAGIVTHPTNSHAALIMICRFAGVPLLSPHHIDWDCTSEAVATTSHTMMPKKRL